MSATARLATFAPLPPDLDACPNCSVSLPQVLRREYWVEERLAGGWVAAYRLMVKGGRPVVAEVRLHPDDPPRAANSGRWSEDPNGIPAEGVPGRALRELRLRVAIQRFDSFLRTLRRDPILRQQLRSLGLPLRGPVQQRRPGRAGRPDEYYLAWAVAYVERLAHGSRRPVKDLAERPPRTMRGYVSDESSASVATIRDIIHQARVRGLLTESPPGLPGGELTPKAERMLKQQDSRRTRR
jgi:hypothetical protein